MKTGKYTIDFVQTGYFGLDGGAMFGVVPKVLWEKSIPSDNLNRITLGTRMPVIRSGSRIIIIDTGIGEYWDEKFNDRFSVDHTEFTPYGGLKQLGITPADVTDVVLTHLHFDHTGGSVISEGGKWIPAFPNAKYHMHQKQFDWAKEPSPKDKGSFASERFVPLAEEGVASFFEGSINLDDEIQLIETNGHTFGHLLVKLTDSSSSYLFCSDLIPTSAHVPLPFIMGFDLQPLLTLDEKSKFLNDAVEENTTLLFQHDTEYTGATVKKVDNGFAVNELIK